MAKRPRGRPPKTKKCEVDLNGNGLTVEDVYNFNIELEDSSQKIQNEPADVRSNRIILKKELFGSQKGNENNKCENCKREFKSEKGLKRHYETCTNMKFESEENGEIKSDSNNYLINGNSALVDLMRESKLDDDFDGNNIIGVYIKQEPNCLIEDGKCDCCGEDINTAHLNGDFECIDCNLYFKLESSYSRHRTLIHNEGETFTCSKCMVKCPSKKLLLSHTRSHHKGSKPVKCPVCQTEFTRKYHLIRHNLQTGCGGTPKQAFACQVCNRIFNRKDNLREHLRAHAGQTKRKKVYHCEYCNVECKGASTLIQHRKQHTGEKPHPCELCNMKFASKTALKKHLRKHTGERPFACGQCGARFSAKETLNRHIKTHTGVKPHVCLFCGKKFIQATQLRSHIFHHTGENGFHCEICGQAFNRKSRLDLHIKYIHEGAKPFECEKCGKTFVRKEDLERHQILHSGVKAHKCDVCGKSFAMKPSLKIHMLTHTKEPPRSCDECGRAYIRQDCFLRHMRAKHRDKLEQIMAETEKKKLKAQLLAMATINGNSGVSDNDSQLKSEFPVYMSDNALTDALTELLVLLLDEQTLKIFQWPQESIDKILENVIRRCGHVPVTTELVSYAECLRENAKLLFTVVIDDSAVKQLLENRTVDEVILHVLKLAKS